MLGLGVTGSAVLRALVAHGESAVAVDDRPTPAGPALADALDVELVEAPDEAALGGRWSRRADAVLPSPGVPDHHPVFALAAAAGVPVLSEFDLAARWDDRPIVAITGTDGKTTVTELTRAMLEASGRRAVAVGNTEVPLVAALDDPDTDVFVVEASSFRLAPQRPLRAAASAPGSTSRRTTSTATPPSRPTSPPRPASGPTSPPTRSPSATPTTRSSPPSWRRRRPATSPSGSPHGADHHVEGDRLVLAGGRRAGPHATSCAAAFPHDLANALAAAATALHGGATEAGARAALLALRRASPTASTLVGEAGGVRWYDDSKATAPHATRAAVRAFPSVVLIAGGRNKGLDLRVLGRRARPHPRRRGHRRGRGRGGRGLRRRPPGRRGRARWTRPSAEAGVAGRAAATSCCCRRPAPRSTGTASYAERGDDFARAVRTSCVGPMSQRAAHADPPTSRAALASPPPDGAARSRRRSGRAPSRASLAVIVVLNLIGLVMVLSASSVSALDTYGSSWYFAMRQAHLARPRHA